MLDPGNSLASYFDTLSRVGDNVVFVFDANDDRYADDVEDLAENYFTDRVCERAGTTLDAIVPFAVDADEFEERDDLAAGEMFSTIEAESQIGWIYVYDRSDGRIFRVESGGMGPLTLNDLDPTNFEGDAQFTLANLPLVVAKRI